MTFTIIKIAILLCVLIIPMRGPSRRKETIAVRPEKTIISSNYGVNENGFLEEINAGNDEAERFL